MRRVVMALLAASLLAPLCGCVVYPARPEGRAYWVPGHWDGPYWHPGHWRRA